MVDRNERTVETGTGLQAARKASGAPSFEAAHGARRAWSKPETIEIPISSTQAIGFNPGDGLTNLS